MSNWLLCRVYIVQWEVLVVFLGGGGVECGLAALKDLKLVM